MFRWKSRTSILAILILVGLLVTTVFATSETLYLPILFNKASAYNEIPYNVQQEALEQIAEQHNLSASSLEIGDAFLETFPLLELEIYHFKFVAKETGESYGIALDTDAAVVNADELAAAEEALSFELYGKLDFELAQALETADRSPEERIDVTIWLNAPEVMALLEARSSLGNFDADHDDLQVVSPQRELDILQAEAELDILHKEAMATVTQPAVENLESLGFTAEANEDFPILYTSLDTFTIHKVSTWDSVDRIYLAIPSESTSGGSVVLQEEDPSDASDVLVDIADNAVRSNSVHSRRIWGIGVRAAQIEVEGRVAANNPYLPEIVHDRTYVCSSNSRHSTGVAGIIHSTHLTRFGIAPAAMLRVGGSCSGSNSQLHNRSTAARNWGADTINLSFGQDRGTNVTPNSHDKYYDSLVYYYKRTVVVAAGNNGNSCGNQTGSVISPALAYNVITVGNFNDRNTATRSDDIMNGCSSWREASGREKPEVAGPGTSINSTTISSPWTGNIGSGTSYAAPVVTGITALMMQRDTRLQRWPDIVKAVIMASALNNIEGSSRLSEFDGAGGVDALHADNVTRGYRGGWSYRSYSCSRPKNYNIRTINLTAGKRTRIVLSWPQRPDYSSYTTRPSVDLDLHIIRVSNNTRVASSSSLRNNYEIVDFTPSASGSYIIRAYRYDSTCSTPPNRLGMAFWRAP